MEIRFIQITAYQLNQMIPLNILYIDGEILAKARREDFHCKFYLGHNGSLYTSYNNKFYRIECN
jgi:hypothetical protein